MVVIRGKGLAADGVGGCTVGRRGEEGRERERVHEQDEEELPS